MRLPLARAAASSGPCGSTKKENILTIILKRYILLLSGKRVHFFILLPLVAGKRDNYTTRVLADKAVCL
jgi:hypothetical protein